MRKLFGTVALLCVAAAVIMATPAAAAWPEKGIRVIVPFAPGGSTDNTMRSIIPALEKVLGVSVTIENVAGGAGLIGVARAMQAKPDGYTFSLNPTSTLANLYTRDMPYDYEKDVQPVANLTSSWVAVVVRPDMPVNNLKEFVAYAKANPLTYASTGVGGITHIYAEAFAAAVGIEMTHVPYRGSSAALNAIMAGHVDVDVDSNVLPQLPTGAVKGIGYINDKPWPGYTQLRPLSEQGIQVPQMSWFGLSTQKAAPKEAVEGMAAALEKAMKDEEVAKRLLNLGLYPNYQGTEEFTRQIAESQKAFYTVLDRLGMIQKKK